MKTPCTFKIDMIESPLSGETSGNLVRARRREVHKEASFILPKATV